MNFRNINTITYNLDDTTRKVQSYLIAETIPVEIYREVLDWARNELDFNKMTISISSNTGEKVLTVIKERPVVVDGLGYCEIEFRGMLVDIKDRDTVVVTDNFHPVLHYSNGVHAYCMVLSDYNPDEVGSFTKNEILTKLTPVFNEVVFEHRDDDIDLTMTRFMFDEEDMQEFMNPRTNILTTPMDFKMGEK